MHQQKHDDEEDLVVDHLLRKTTQRLEYSKNTKKRKGDDKDFEKTQPISVKRRNTDDPNSSSTLTSLNVNYDCVEPHQQHYIGYLHTPWNIQIGHFSSSPSLQITRLMEAEKFSAAFALTQQLMSTNVITSHVDDGNNDNNDKVQDSYLRMLQATIYYQCREFKLAIQTFRKCLEALIDDNDIELRQNVIKGFICSLLMNSDYVSCLSNFWRFSAELPRLFILDLVIVWLCKISIRQLLIGIPLSILPLLLIVVYKIRFWSRRPLKVYRSNQQTTPMTNMDATPVPHNSDSISFLSHDFTTMYNDAGKQVTTRNKSYRTIPSDKDIDGQMAIYGQRIIMQPYYQHSILDTYKPLRDYQQQQEREGTP